MNAKIYKTNNSGTDIYKSLVALTAILALIGSQLFFIGARTAQAQGDDKQQKLAAQNRNVSSAKSEIRNVAMRYDRAVSQVRMLSSRTLNTKQEVESAVSSLRQSRSTLERGPYPALVNMALNDAGFKRAVEAEARRVGHERLMTQLRRSPGMVMKISGANQLESKMKSDLSQQANLFKTLGNKLKAAQQRLEREAKEARQNRKGAFVQRLDNSFFNSALASYHPAVLNLEKTQTAKYQTRIVPVRYNTGGTYLTVAPGTIEAALIAAAIVIIGAAAAAAALLITKWAERKAVEITEEDPETGKTTFRECTDDADARLDQCLAAIPAVPGNLPFWEKVAAEAEKAAKESACWAVWNLRMADCLLIPQ